MLCPETSMMRQELIERAVAGIRCDECSDGDYEWRLADLTDQERRYVWGVIIDEDVRCVIESDRQIVQAL